MPEFPKQTIRMVVWRCQHKMTCQILDHQRIETPGGDVSIRGMSKFFTPKEVPEYAGLYLVEATAETVKVPGFGVDVRINILSHQRIAGGLAELLVNNGRAS